jgi:uncharacterized protein
VGSPVRVVNGTRETVLAARARLADGPWSRLRGLLGSSRLADGDGMVLEPCRSVHTFFLRYPIDVVFAARDGRVVAIAEALPPWRMTSWHPTAWRAVELPAGTVASTRTARGDVLLVESLEEPCVSS